MIATLGLALPAQAAEQADPNRWLEDVTGEKALSWVKAHNTATGSFLEKEPGFAGLQTQIREILDSKAKIPNVVKMGAYYYNFWRDADHQRGVWRRTTLEEYRKTEPVWETVIDLDAVATADKENWVWKGADCRYPAWDRCLVNLSRGGADAVVIKEFDLNTKQFVADGFTLPEGHNEVTWQGKDAVFVGTDFGPGSMTETGYPRISKLWQRGTPVSTAKLVYEGQKGDVQVGSYVYEREGYRYEIVQRTPTFFTNEYFLREGDKLTQIAVPQDAVLSFFGPQMLIKLRAAWTVDGHTYASGSLLAADFAGFRAGKREFSVLFEPTDTTALSDSMASTQHYLILSTLDNVKGRLIEWHFDQGKWTQRKVDAPAFGSLGVESIDEDASDDYFMTSVDFLTPDSLSLAHGGTDARELLKQRPTYFDASKYEIAQNEAVSKDGTHVPYFIVKAKGLKLDGNNPTLLYGYGGFEISMTPYYSASMGKGWLEKGGVYVLANIRGGGEFGPRWHDAALKSKRQNAYDDFIAVAEDLVARKITQPKKLGIMGGSNGGLLMGVMMTERPDLFGAVVCQVPLLDMRRFNKMLVGAQWMGEYGNPDDPKDWAYIKRFSPYHNLHKNTKYPNILFTTSTRDDRVHPGHARKMMAQMEKLGVKSVWYYENTEGGHAGAANNKQVAYMTALEYTFLWKMLNP
ncbi:MAG: S9 family peptidase [Burkholderiales bacterium]|nr:S9 family peptidase [Burkholderiales bacterium]